MVRKLDQAKRNLREMRAVAARVGVEIRPDMSAEEISERVNKRAHIQQFVQLRMAAHKAAGAMDRASSPTPGPLAPPGTFASFYVAPTVEAWAVYTTVQTIKDIAGGDPAKEAELLTADLGPHVGVRDALKVYDQVRAVVRPVETVTGSRVSVLCPPPPPRRRPKRWKRPVGELFVYAHKRARALGYLPADLFVSQQGRWSSRSEEARSARGQIATELRDKGATLDQIGQVLGGLSRPTVHELLKRQEGAKHGG